MPLRVQTRHVDVRTGHKTKPKFKIMSRRAANGLQTEHSDPSRVSYGSRRASHPSRWPSTVGQLIYIILPRLERICP